MKKRLIAPVLHLFFIVMVVKLKLIYGNLHWTLAKLSRVDGIDKELRKFSDNLNWLFWIVLMSGFISLILALVCFYKKIYSRSVVLIVLLVAVLCFLFAVIQM